jgi:hypothetical protein
LVKAGAENSTISCNGAIFLGAPKEGVKGTKAAFASLTDQEYLVKNLTNGANEIQCNVAQFGGKPDFLGDQKKECFCDSSVYYSAARVQIDQDRFKSQKVLATLETTLKSQKEMQEKVIKERDEQAKKIKEMDTKKAEIKAKFQEKYTKEKKDAFEKEKTEIEAKIKDNTEK